MRPLAVITGGTSGIGFAAAQALRKDYDLLLIYRNRHTVAEAARQSLLSIDTRVEILAVDLTTPDAGQKIRDRIDQIGRPVQVLLNAAGHTLSRLYLRTSDDEIADLIGTHVTGTMKATRLVLEEMYRLGKGRIINISSIAVSSKRGLVAYATAKAAVEGFTRSLAAELVDRNITVNAIRPGPVGDTLIASIVRTIEFLVSEAAADTTGTIIDL